MKSSSDSNSLPTGSNSAAQATGLGTFGGVFTPSILTILGVIMYLCFGWVVGNAGLIGTLIIVSISTAITFLTALSVCAIAEIHNSKRNLVNNYRINPFRNRDK